jgi:hypothetical protein
MSDYDEFARKLRGEQDAQFGTPTEVSLEEYGRDMRGQLDAQLGAPSAVQAGLDRPQRSFADALGVPSPVDENGMPPQRGPMLGFGFTETMGAPVTSAPIPSDPMAGIQKALGVTGGSAQPPRVNLPDAPRDDLSGVSNGPSKMPDLSMGPSARLTPAQIDKRFGAQDMNVDTSGMRGPADSRPSLGSAASQEAMMPRATPARFIGAHHDDSLDYRTASTRGEMLRDAQNGVINERNMVRAETAQSEAIANIMEKEAVNSAIRRSIAEDEERARQTHVEEERARVAEAREAVKNGKVDTTQLYGDTDTSTRLGLIIGGALGGLSSALNGGPNVFMDQINRNIQNNIRGQEAELEKRKGLYASAQGSQRDRLAENRESRIAANEKEQMMLTDVQNQIRATTQRTNSPIMKARGEMLMDAAQAKITALDETRDRMTYVRPQMVGGTGGASTARTPQLLIKMPDGSTRLAATKETYTDATKAVGFTQNIKSNINEALAIRKAASAIDLANPYSAVTKQLQSLESDTKQLITVRRGQGAMSAGDAEVARSAVGQFDSFWNGAANEAVMRGASARESKHLEGDVNALGLEKVDTGYRYDEKGRLVPDSEYSGESDKPRVNMPKSRESK